MILYCEHGPFADRAKFVTWTVGYKNINYLEGHISGWKERGGEPKFHRRKAYIRASSMIKSTSRLLICRLIGIKHLHLMNILNRMPKIKRKSNFINECWLGRSLSPFVNAEGNCVCFRKFPTVRRTQSLLARLLTNPIKFPVDR